MNFEEVKLILKRLFKEHVKKHMKRILVALVLSLIVAGSTSGIAWLLDPAVKKIFIEQNEVFAWTIPVLIVVAFSSKGCVSLTPFHSTFLPLDFLGLYRGWWRAAQQESEYGWSNQR